MAGATNAEAKATLDLRFPVTGASDYVMYSVNGTSEWGGGSPSLTRTAVGATNWAPATLADPSVKANSAAITTAAATAAGTVTHFAIISAASGGTQRTDWTPLADAKAVSSGDTLTWGPGALQITLT